jgi:hypothetical protein
LSPQDVSNLLDAIPVMKETPAISSDTFVSRFSRAPYGAAHQTVTVRVDSGDHRQLDLCCSSRDGLVRCINYGHLPRTSSASLILAALTAGWHAQRRTSSQEAG